MEYLWFSIVVSIDILVIVLEEMFLFLEWEFFILVKFKKKKGFSMVIDLEDIKWDRSVDVNGGFEFVLVSISVVFMFFLLVDLLGFGVVFFVFVGFLFFFGGSGLFVDVFLDLDRKSVV